ncbi:UBX10 protein, partial [Brachypteracias leptosomus]|nr:UBX10 protein [Brachypteracias leptosomus]
MATAAPLSSAPSPLCFPPSTAAPLSWADPPTMHVSRPKSAKGRRRSSFTCSQSLGACPCQVPPSPQPAAPHELLSTRRALPTKAAFPAGQVSPEEIPELLQQVPSRSSSSLNRYRVLPSIGWRGPVEGVAEQSNQLRVSEGREEAPEIPTLPGEQGPAGVLAEGDVESSHAPCPPEKPGGKLRQESPLGVAEALAEEPPLLLAVRSPSGQRFEHHFKPSDSLQRVLAVAEQRTLAQYKHCSVETMEVPRRSFSDLTRSLQDCGILPKSVLCIRQKEQRDVDL